MSREPYAPDVAQAHRRQVINAMRLGREYTTTDIQRRTGLPMRVVFHSLGALRLMGLVQTVTVTKTRIYCLQAQEAAE